MHFRENKYILHLQLYIIQFLILPIYGYIVIKNTLYHSKQI